MTAIVISGKFLFHFFSLNGIIAKTDEIVKGGLMVTQTDEIVNNDRGSEMIEPETYVI